MFHHFILLQSNFSKGKRVAFHRVSDDIEGLKEFNQMTHDLKHGFNELSFGFHHIKTSSQDWQSVIKYDPFFEDVIPISSLSVFKKYLLDDEKVTVYDIANLIVSRIECTHLKLQKLLYLYYIEFIKKYDYPSF
ncbi:hypothetical protein ABID56_000859 [Alkalibacillus flavidus]|uniref:Uncharacterized protein n=1 Tax=Alkalibacillus flavidus TaxID=546021 RepID=A0ABV2KT72_9BACI